MMCVRRIIPLFTTSKSNVTFQDRIRERDKTYKRGITLRRILTVIMIKKYYYSFTNEVFRNMTDTGVFIRLLPLTRLSVYGQLDDPCTEVQNVYFSNPRDAG